MMLSIVLPVYNERDNIKQLYTEVDKDYLIVISEYDVGCGWRKERKDTLAKKFPSMVSNWLARKLSGINIHDFGCTLKAYKREAINGLNLYGETHRYIPIILSWEGFSIGEVVTNHRERKHGKTKYGVSRLIRGFFDLLSLCFLSRYSVRPLQYFGLVSLVMVFLGLVFGLYLTFIKLVLGASIIERTPLLMLTAILLITGVQLLSVGFLGEILIKLQYKSDYQKKIK